MTASLPVLLVSSSWYQRDCNSINSSILQLAPFLQASSSVRYRRWWRRRTFQISSRNLFGCGNASEREPPWPYPLCILHLAFFGERWHCMQTTSPSRGCRRRCWRSLSLTKIRSKPTTHPEYILSILFDCVWRSHASLRKSCPDGFYDALIYDARFRQYALKLMIFFSPRPGEISRRRGCSWTTTSISEKFPRCGDEFTRCLDDRHKAISIPMHHIVWHLLDTSRLDVWVGGEQTLKCTWHVYQTTISKTHRPHEFSSDRVILIKTNRSTENWAAAEADASLGGE